MQAKARQHALELQAPVVEVAATTSGVPGGTSRSMKACRRSTWRMRLPGMSPQVHHDDMHLAALYVHLYMQQPALLEAVVEMSSCWCPITGQRVSSALPCSPCLVMALVRYTAS